jgi:hypothetical protein
LKENSSIEMKKIVRILLLEDNPYFNNLLLQELRNCVKGDRFKLNFSFMFHNFTDAGELIMRLKSQDFKDNYSIAFIDYYLGSGINGSHIIKILKEQSAETAIVLISQSKSVKEKVDPSSYDYFVPKDNSAAALCRLCLEQYLENKFFIHWV